MGSPVSAVMAKMVMEDLEERALTTLPNQPLFWKRLVDDLSTTTKPDSTQTFLEHLSSIESRIKFTIERESEGRIAFLDSIVQHQEDGNLATTIYTGNLPTLIAICRFHRTIPVCTSELWLSHWWIGPQNPHKKTDQIKEKQRVISTLQSSGFPKHFILGAR